MKLRIVSDLHSNHTLDDSFSLPVMDGEEEQTLILAGDIGQGVSACNLVSGWAKRFKYVVYVLGNHEFYMQHYIEAVEADIKAELSEHTNVYVLCDEGVVLDAQPIWGSVFWTDMGSGDWFVQNSIKLGINDFRCINRWHPLKGKPVRFTVDCAAHYFTESFHKLQRWTDQHNGVVVVTHHAPSFKSCLSCYITDSVSYAYYNTLTGHWLAATDVVSLWIHGHIHNTSDYVIGETRIICNPAGYPRKGVVDFNSSLIVEV